MASQTFLTVAEAALRVGKSRQTIFEKIKQGKLSATANAQGTKVIQVPELIRVFGALLSDDELSRNHANKAGQPAASSLTATLQLELELANLRLVHAQKELETSNRQLEEMRVRERQSIEDRTQLLGVIERQTLLLAAPKPAKAPTKAAKSTPRATAALPPKKPAATVKKAPALVVKKAPAKTVPKKAPAPMVKKPVAKATARSKAAPVSRTR